MNREPAERLLDERPEEIQRIHVEGDVQQVSCRNADVSKRQYAPSSTPVSTSRRCHRSLRQHRAVLEQSAAVCRRSARVSRKAATLMPIRTMRDDAGRLAMAPPAIVRAARTDFAPSACTTGTGSRPRRPACSQGRSAARTAGTRCRPRGQGGGSSDSPAPEGSCLRALDLNFSMITGSIGRSNRRARRRRSRRPRPCWRRRRPRRRWCACG